MLNVWRFEDEIGIPLAIREKIWRRGFKLEDLVEERFPQPDPSPKLDAVHESRTEIISCTSLSIFNPLSQKHFMDQVQSPLLSLHPLVPRCHQNCASTLHWKLLGTGCSSAPWCVDC